MMKHEAILNDRIALKRTSCLLTVMLLAVASAPAHEGHDHASEKVEASPFVASLRVKLGATRFQPGPVSRDLLNTLVIPGEGRASIPAPVPGIRRLGILHTGLSLEEAAECRIEIQYEGLDEPVVQPWKVYDWQAKSDTPPGKEVVSGLWWYRRDKGLVVDDANAKIYVENIEVDPARRVESIKFIAPELPQGEIRVYAVSALTVGTHAWTAIDMSKQFNSDTILSEATRIPTDGKMYFATEFTEALAQKKADATGSGSVVDGPRPTAED